MKTFHAHQYEKYLRLNCFIHFIVLIHTLSFKYKGSFKRKSEVLNSSNIKRQCPKTIAFNFASSTPTLVTPNNQPNNTSSKYLFKLFRIFLTFLLVL